jgi:hypothetical protein
VDLTKAVVMVAIAAAAVLGVGQKAAAAIPIWTTKSRFKRKSRGACILTLIAEIAAFGGGTLPYYWQLPRQ